MKMSLPPVVQTLCDMVCRPQVRHEISYECGLYKRPEDRSPITSLRLDHQGGMPLVKLVAIVGGVISVLLALRWLCRATQCMMDKCHTKKSQDQA